MGQPDLEPELSITTVTEMASAGYPRSFHFLGVRPAPWPTHSVFAVRCAECGTAHRYTPGDQTPEICEHIYSGMRSQDMKRFFEDHWFTTEGLAVAEGF